MLLKRKKRLEGQKRMKVQRKPVVLFRRCFNLSDTDVQEEFEIAQRYLPVVETRTEAPPNSLVIGRYSVLPYYSELAKELASKGSQLVNSHDQHLYVADICEYADHLREYTPRTHTTWGHLKQGAWIVKGKTNSRKFNWNTMMYAEGREQLLEVIGRLLDDPFIAEQGLVVRDFVPLDVIDYGLHGLPIAKEWRCFYWGERMLASGFYWASHAEDFDEPLPDEGREFADGVARLVAQRCQFFVMDVAKKQGGGYTVIELNDAQMSGLSLVDPHELYRNLAEACK